MVSRTARWATTLVAVLGLILGTAVPATAAAAPVTAGVNGPAKMSLSGWSAGNIISDAVFTDRTTMTEAQIQSFFNSKVRTCRGGTDKYGPIICLKDYKTDSVTRSADAYCKGYTGARGESAARIIYRVAQSCGINPQVLIVMLQKEQGLVTHTYPSKWRYDKALGQGCPDDAPCNPAYVGFFHQIYGAARQMQIYMEGRYFTWYKPGNTWKIRYDVEIACGSSPVYVANKATSALYYYTPYQPNAASLRAGYGTGDGCSSYGNRNFYNYFTDWFGSTQKPAVTVDPLRDIKTLYTSLGGSTGVLGAVKTNPSCTSTTARCTQTYANGIITWTKALGALTVYGPIYKEYLAQGGLGGVLGYPKETPRAVTDPNGNGVTQQFDRGWIHQSAAGTFASTTRFMTAYSAAGWLRGPLGWPTSAEVCTSASCVQDFSGGFIGAATGKPASATLKATSKSIDSLHAAQGGSAGALGTKAGDRTLVTDPHGDGLAQQYQNGYIHASEAGTFSTSTALMTAYSKAGWLRGALGWPVNAEQKITDANGNGLVQGFQGGWIHSSPSGTFSTSSRMMTAYSAAGWLRGALGWPSSAEVCTGSACAQAFAGGLISYSGSNAAAATIGVSAAAITKVHTAAGGSKGSLGAATESAGVVASENGSGLTRGFAGGRIHSSAAGTFASSTTIMTAYSAAGWLRGKLGWPTGAETCSGTYCSQAFQGGSIAYTKGKAAVPLVGVAPGAIDAAYKAAGGSAGSLGAVAADTSVVSDRNGNGLARKYQRGFIHASAAGTFSSSTTIMTAYSAAGWLRGKLGWPTGAETCSGTYCSQAFQGGSIAYTKGKAAVPLVGVAPGAIDAAYKAAGGSAGSLGAVAADTSVVSDRNGNGLARKYERGFIHASAAGTFSSSTTIMTAYSAAGWLRGKLGWPTGAETCSATSCSQAFRGGSISYAIGKPATVTYR